MGKPMCFIWCNLKYLKSNNVWTLCYIIGKKSKIKLTFNLEYKKTTQEQCLNQGREIILENVRYFTLTKMALLIHNDWRKKWQPTPVFLPGESPPTEETGRLQGAAKSPTRLSDRAAACTIIHLLLFLHNCMRASHHRSTLAILRFFFSIKSPIRLPNREPKMNNSIDSAFYSFSIIYLKVTQHNSFQRFFLCLIQENVLLIFEYLSLLRFILLFIIAINDCSYYIILFIHLLYLSWIYS